MPGRCRILRYLTAYADDELTGRLLRKVEEHLSRCEGCARELDSIRASDRMLRVASAPAVSDDRWADFHRDLSSALDDVDRQARKPARIRELRPVHGTLRRRTFAAAGAFAVVLAAALLLGPASNLRWWNGGRDRCIVDSIETYASGYTPMFFSSKDPEMTVIWVFHEEVEGGFGGEAPGAR